MQTTTKQQIIDNKVISSSEWTYNFTYNADRQRCKTVLKKMGVVKRTKYYANGNYEKERAFSALLKDANRMGFSPNIVLIFRDKAQTYRYINQRAEARC